MKLLLKTREIVVQNYLAILSNLLVLLERVLLSNLATGLILPLKTAGHLLKMICWMVNDGRNIPGVMLLYQ